MGCLRGVSTLTAFALAVEIGDWHRLTGRSVGAYVGLVPSESSSGDHARGADHQDRNGTSAGCSLKRPGTTAPRIAQCRAAAPLGSGQSGGTGPGPRG